MEKKRQEVEKAKLTGAPPPAIRPQANRDLTLDMLQEKVPAQQRSDAAQPQAARTQPTTYRAQEDNGRAPNPMLLNSSKVPPKRPLPQETGDDSHSRPATQRNPPAYHDGHQAKRRRTSELADGRADNSEAHPKMTAPPIRQSNIRQKVRGPGPVVYTSQILVLTSTGHPIKNNLPQWIRQCAAARQFAKINPYLAAQSVEARASVGYGASIQGPNSVCNKRKSSQHSATQNPSSARSSSGGSERQVSRQVSG